MGKFALDLEAFNDVVDRRSNAVIRKIVFEVDRSLVEKTPVGNPDLWKSPPRPGYVGGRLRANWQYGLNTPNFKTTEDTDANGQASIERVVGAVAPDAAGKIHYLTNSLPYAKRVEDGWSTQAPSGMVEVTIVEFMPIVTACVAEIKATIK